MRSASHFLNTSDLFLQARQKILGRGALIGINQAEEVEALRSMVPSWDKQLEQVQDQSLTYPEYYVQPFHAYDSGNLCWEAAFQVKLCLTQEKLNKAQLISKQLLLEIQHGLRSKASPSSHFM